MSAGRRAHLQLAALALALVGITLIHDPAVLAVGLLSLVLVTRRNAGRLLKRALLGVAFVNLTVTVGYVAVAFWEGIPWAEYVLRLNLRVLLLTYLTLWAVERVDLRAAASFSRSLLFLMTIALGQVRILRDVLSTRRDAWRSRTPASAGLQDRYRGATADLEAVFTKATTQSEELTDAMRSRGVFTR